LKEDRGRNTTTTTTIVYYYLSTVKKKKPSLHWKSVPIIPQSCNVITMIFNIVLPVSIQKKTWLRDQRTKCGDLSLFGMIPVIEAVFTLGMFGSIKVNPGAIALFVWFI